MTQQTTLAGHKIERWRNGSVTRVTREALADRLGIDQTAIRHWERSGRRPQIDSIVNWFAENGVASHADWYVRAPLYHPGRPYLCTLCEKRNDDPVVRQCTRMGCPNVGKVLEEEMAV